MLFLLFSRTSGMNGAIKRGFDSNPLGEMDLSVSKRTRIDDTLSNTTNKDNNTHTTQMASLLIDETKESIPEIVQQNQQILKQSCDASSESGDSSDPERLQVDMSQVKYTIIFVSYLQQSKEIYIYFLNLNLKEI